MKSFTFLKGPRKKFSCVRGQVMPSRENQYSYHLSVWNIFNKRPKFTFAQSKRFPPKHNVLDRENHLLEQAAFLHEVKVVYFLPIPLFNTGEITMTVGRCTPNLKNSLHEQTSDIKIRLLVGHRKYPFPWAASPKLPSASILKQIPGLARANPGNQHLSFYSKSLRNLFITHCTEYREWFVENITW